MVEVFFHNLRNQFIFLLKLDFHQLDQIIMPKNKIFEINVWSKSFFFSKEQLILISIKSFLWILDYKASFGIVSSSTLSEYLLISCFNDIFLLFSSKSEILISQHTVIAFQYLSEILENPDLFSVCQKVKSFNEPQLFYLTSEIFNQISPSVFHLLNDFGVILSDCNLDCNMFYASLISKKISNGLKIHQLILSLIFQIIQTQR
jgi:hypothetical protein